MGLTWTSSALAVLVADRRRQLRRSWDEIARRAADEVLHVSVDDFYRTVNEDFTEMPDMVLLRALSVGLELPMEDVLEAAAHSFKPPRPRPGRR